ncbi:MAG: hypothetical protein WC867_07090 [Candidatus Pacearchaeota archaeon]|jgi:bifunctional DNA-binding transcriptional regulator/antitoxin component of YhaV-PrlF toxin-antitoxin module
MTEILFKGSKIQTGERIKIPKPIVDTLNLYSGQGIIIIFDAEKKEIIIREEKNKKDKK